MFVSFEYISALFVRTSNYIQLFFMQYNGVLTSLWRWIEVDEFNQVAELAGVFLKQLALSSPSSDSGEQPVWFYS
jgi:hypothetical protein